MKSAAPTHQRGDYWLGVAIITAIIIGIVIISSLVGSGNHSSFKPANSSVSLTTHHVEYGLMAFDMDTSRWKFMGRVFTSDVHASLPNYTVSRAPLAECMKWASELHNLLLSSGDLGATGCQDLSSGKIIRSPSHQ